MFLKKKEKNNPTLTNHIAEMCMRSGINSDDDSCVERSSVDLNDNNLIDSTTTNTVVNQRLVVIYIFYLHDTCLNLIHFLLLVRKKHV